MPDQPTFHRKLDYYLGEAVRKVFGDENVSKNIPEPENLTATYTVQHDGKIFHIRAGTDSEFLAGPWVGIGRNEWILLRIRSFPVGQHPEGEHASDELTSGLQLDFDRLPDKLAGLIAGDIEEWLRYRFRDHARQSATNDRA